MPVVQAKLRIGAPHDKYEQEADRIADELVRTPDCISTPTNIADSPPVLQKKCSECTEGNLCPKCAEEEEVVQRKSLAAQITPLIHQRGMEGHEDAEAKAAKAKGDSGEITMGSPLFEARLNKLSASGQPLSQSERAFFEPRFGYDLSQVLTHTNDQAAELAQVVNARAFTIGPHIVFGAGWRAPEAIEGRRLLAHELTHVIQQTGKGGSHHSLLQRDGFGEVRVTEAGLEKGLEPSPPERNAPLDCNTPIGDVFKLLATATSERPECSTALIQDRRVTNLLPKTYRADYFLGDVPECPFPVADFDHWLGDQWNILQIEDWRVIVINQCGEEEYLEMEAGAPPLIMVPPQELVEEPKNPPQIDPSADPEKEWSTGRGKLERGNLGREGTRGQTRRRNDPALSRRGHRSSNLPAPAEKYGSVRQV